MAGSKKIAAHVKVEYPELEAGTKEVREVVKSAIQQAKQAAASTPDLVSASRHDDLTRLCWAGWGFCRPCRKTFPSLL